MTDGLTQRYDPDAGLAEPAIRLTPEQARAGKEVGRQHGIPAPAAALIPDVADLAEKARRKSMLSGSPLTQRWTADPINGALAQGDEENLSALEKAGNALWKGVLRTGAGAQILGADLAAQRKADIGKTIEQIAREINPEFDQLSGGVQANILMAARERWTRAGAGEAPEGFAEAMDATARDYTTSASGLMQDAGALEGFEASERMAQALEPAREVDGTFSQILSALSIMAENPLDAAVFLGQTALESAAPTIAGAAATAITRSPAIGIGVMGAGSATAETSGVVQEFLGERGIDLRTPEGIDAALADPGLFQEAVDRGLAKGLVVALVDAASGGVAGKALARSPVGDMVAQAGVQAFSGALGEGLGSLAAGLEVSGVDLLLEAFAELVTTPAEVFGVAGRTLGDMRMRARGAGRTEQALQEIGAIAEKSQLRERDPGAFRDFLDQAGHGDALIGLPAQEVDTFFQAAADGTPLDLLEVTPEAYQEALASGGDIYVPSAVFAERFAGTDAAELFHRHGTLNDGEMSTADAEAFNAAWREEVERAAEAYQTEVSERLDTLESDIQVRDQIFTQLRAAGQSAEVADRNATVWQSLFRTLGERYGEDALDLLRQFGIRIEGPQTPQSRRISQIDTMLETLRRTGAPKERSAGTSLVQSLVDRGGVRGLDIADAPDGLVLEDGPDLLGDTAGVDIDGAAQQALEDGFFPEHQWMLDQSATVTDADAAALRDAFVSAVETELQGQPVARTISDVSPDVLALEDALRDLAAELDRLGIDLAEASNDQIVAALQEGETLNQGDESPRGSISFPAEGAANGETVIRLFESADLSTFAHESAHFFLEVTRDLAEREDAPQAMKDDLAAIYSFIGHEGGSLSTESHETFARAWESYMMEGKAPSLALADVFARMKAWLTNIYRSLAGLNVNLTAEIREVFDRMLATDEEIAAARDMLGMDALFPDPQSAGMTEAEFAPYRRMATRAGQQAEQTLMERTLRKIRREREAWFKEEREALRAEIASTIYTRPEQRLIDMIANRKWYGEDEREVPDFRIDRAALIERFGEGILAQIGRDKFGGKRAIYTGRGEAGASPDEVAEYFGFESADAMVDALLNAGKTEALIDAEVDREMASRYGDPLNDGTIEDEALRAVHSEQQAKTVAAEARQLAKRAGKDARGITSRIFRQRARVMLGKMPVREAMRPARFLEAERRAARSASKEFAKVASGRGDSVESLSSAHRFKEQQLLNQYLYMEARDLEKRVNSGRERMRGFEKASVRKSIPTEYLEQIDALLDQHEFRKISQKEVDRREGLRAYAEQMKAEGREAELNIDDRILERAGRTHYTRLTADEFQGLLDTIDNIAHMGRFKGKLLDAKAERDLSAIVDEIGAEAAANLSGNPPGRGSATRGERARDTFRAALSWTLNPDTYLREIDGFKDLGPAYRHIKEPIDKAMGRLVERRQQMAKDFDQLYSTYSLKEQRAMVAKKAIPDAGVSLSKWDSLAVALNTGNEDNYARLVSGGEGSFTTGQVEAILATLDRRDWEFVQSMWDYIGGFWPEIEAKEKRQTGTAPKKVQARPMVPAYSFLKGGYYPLKYDGRLSGLASDFESKALADGIMGGRFGKAQTKNGHTKERVNGVKQPVVLDMAVAHSHVQQVVHDIELSEALSASYKILQRLRPYYQNSSRLPDFEALELWLQDTAAGEQVAAHGMQKYIRHVRSGFTVSRLAMNIGTVLIQPSGLSQSFVQVGKKAMARGVVDYVAHRERWVKTALDASPFMRERVQTFERDIYNVVGDATSGPVSGRWEKFQRDYMLPASFWLMQKVQFHTVDMPTWVGAYQDEMRRTSDPERAVTHADQMVRRSQGSGLMSDRGMMERGTMSRTSRQQELPRLFTALGSYMFAKFNVAYEKTAGTDFRQPREVASLAADFVLLFTFEALLYQAVKGGLPDDDEDEGWAKWAASETALSMLSTFPFAREFAGALSGFGGGGITGGFTETFARPFIQASQGEWDQAAAKAGWGAIGTLFHLPVSQINYAIGAFFDEDMAFKRNPSLAEAVLGPSR